MDQAIRRTVTVVIVYTTTMSMRRMRRTQHHNIRQPIQTDVHQTQTINWTISTMQRKLQLKLQRRRRRQQQRPQHRDRANKQQHMPPNTDVTCPKNLNWIMEAILR